MREHMGRVAAPIALLLATLLAGGARVASAQDRADTTRVTYRTRDVVFIAAGRAEGVAVGDTVQVEGDSAFAPVLAVVLSLARHSASALLLDPGSRVRAGQRARYRAHPVPAEAAPEPAPDTALAVPAAAPVAPAAPPEPAMHRARAPPVAATRLTGSVQLDEYAFSPGVPGFTTHQTSLGLSIRAPLGGAGELRLRTRSRWRDGATDAGLDGLSHLFYQAELRLAPRGAPWGLTVGRLFPTDLMVLGFLDGAQFDVRLGAGHRVGLLGGFVPDAADLGFSSATARVAGWWAFGESGRLTGALGGAADWADGAHRRTQLAAQTQWRPGDRTTLSLYANADVPAAWDSSSSGITISTLSVSLHAPLPAGFRGGIALESHQAARLWDRLASDSLPLPGRLDGVTLSLGRELGGVGLDASVGALRRSGDPNPTYRGTLFVHWRGISVTATGVRGDLADYTSLLARFVLPRRALPVLVSISGLASVTTTPAGGASPRRVAVRPEVSRMLAGGLFLSAGGEFGRQAGRATTSAHAGVSYHFR
jgi:hypothetical protein